ncbi:hypothetical protein PQR62_25285 [Herbaspirillum lusitanum]|uniref:Biotin carboxyl carrier protein n=1 Tax=Herbaspirillum lusitanum TaxID=213312 RepID=A0ABW9AGI7_9BURK
MNLDELRALIALMDASDLTLLELKRPAADLRLRLEAARSEAAARSASGAAVVPALAANSAEAAVQVKAPAFGIFTTRHPARGEAFCADGQQVEQGQTLGMLRINELYVPVISPAAGTLRRLVEEETLTGYATPLFDIVV